MEHFFDHRDMVATKAILNFWPYAACLSLLVYYIVTTVRAYWRLRHIPGPKLAAISNLWYWVSATSGKAHLIFDSVAEQYGSIARIAPNILVTTDEELIRKMNAFRGSSYTRAKWYQAFSFDAERGNIFTELDEEKHQKMRNRVTTGYKGKDNPNLEGDMNQVIWSAIDLIRRRYLSNGPCLKAMDFSCVAQYFTLDMITTLALGRPFGFITEDKDMYEYVKTIRNNLPVVHALATVPLLGAIARSPIFRGFAIPSVKDRVGIGKAKTVAAEMIARRFGSDKEVRSDMAGSFIEHGLTQTEVADEAIVQLFAGSDTVAVTTRTGFISIMSNAQVYARLQAECLAADVPMSSIISNAQAMQLPYLKAVVKEVLRQNPVATGILPKVVGPKGDIHNGLYLPAGTEIGVCLWHVLRSNTAVYGEDAKIFRPERWLEASPEKLAMMDKTLELAFGYGRFRCLGDNIAKIELHKFFFEMFRRFDWSLIDAQKPFEKNVNHTVFIQQGLWIRVSERQM